MFGNQRITRELRVFVYEQSVSSVTCLFLKTSLVVFGTNIFAVVMCVFCAYNIWYFHSHELVVLSCSELD